MATTRIKDIQATATESDLASGNYFAVDTPNITKKLPADLLPAASSIAPVFSASTAYSAGDAVMYKGKLWRFKVDHTGSWLADDVRAILVMDVADATNLCVETLRKNAHSRNVVAIGLDGYYREENGVVEYRHSENWTCYRVPVSGLLYVKTLAGRSTSVTPALIFLDATGNYLARAQGDVMYQSSIYYFDEMVKPPAGATTCLVNHYSVPGLSFNLEIQVIDNNYVGFTSKRDFTQSNGKYVYYGENGVELTSSSNWDYQIISVENLRKIITYCGGYSQRALPISFFKGAAEEASINNTNFISGFQNSTSEGSRCEIDVVVPPDATFAVVNCLLLHDDGTFGAYYDAYYDAIKVASRYVVAQDGSGDYTSVTDAVDSVPNGSTIIVMPGVYEGNVRAWQKYVNIIGVNKEQCVLVSYDGRYDNPAVEMSCGMLCNLTIASKYDADKTEWQEGDAKAYALHIENNSNSALVEGKEMVIKNCILYSDFNPAIGCGTFVNWTLRVEDCDLTNNQGTDGIATSQYATDGSLGALYIHDQNGSNSGVGKVVIKNNILRCNNYTAALCMYDRNLADRGLDFTLVSNVLVGTSGQSDTIWWRSTTTPFGGDFAKNAASYGNSNTQLNN